MRFWTIKFATVKLMAVFVGVCIVFGIILATGGFGDMGSRMVSAVPASATPDMSDSTKRIEFLKSFGWEVEEAPVSGKKVTIPKSFDAVYRKYNTDVQLPGGYDLTKYAGRQVTLYCYRVLNYPTEDEVLANLLVYDGKIIGGDICSVALDGFMHGFSMPDGLPSPTAVQLDD